MSNGFISSPTTGVAGYIGDEEVEIKVTVHAVFTKKVKPGDTITTDDWSSGDFTVKYEKKEE